MKLAIMQPYFFPYIGYFQAIHAVDKYILYSNLTFIKDGWMNRNRLMLSNGSTMTFSVPVLSKSSNTQIHDIRIDNSQKWAQKLLKTIFFNYKKAPFFVQVYPLFEDILSTHYEFLVELNSQSIKQISEYLSIQTVIEDDIIEYRSLEEVLLQVDEANYSALDYLQKTKPVKKVARVIALCKNENSSVFINAIGGQELYDKNEFTEYGIDLKFIQTDNKIKYTQFSPEFIPNLSIIDVLMHNGKEGSLELIKKYTLI